MAISKIKLPDNISATDIHDSRISGIDSIPTANSVNLITSGGTKTYIDGALLFESGVGSNSVVQKGSNNTAFGNNSIIEGISSAKATEQGIVSGSSDSNIINAWITSPFALAKGIASHVEGNNGLALANYSHVEGLGTIAINVGEHAEGQYNKSNATTISSVGIGTSSTRKNAFEIMQNGNTYIYGIGNYDGTNSISGTPASIQQIINGQKTTNQELVFRKTGVNWSPNTLTLDRILGRTLAWNQIVPIPTNSISTTVYTVVFTDNRDGSYKIQGTPSGSSAATIIINTIGVIAGHKYYCSDAFFQEYSSSVWVRNLQDSTSQLPIVASTTTGDRFRVSLWVNPGVTVNKTVYPNIVDLTLLYGSEIDGMTDAQILAKFESEFPGYHGPSAGKLISNDASALETVGFNQWDEEWEYGTLVYNTGEKNLGGSSSIVSKNFIPIIPGETYYIKHSNASGSFNRIAYYDANKVYLGANNVGWSVFNTGTKTVPSTAYYCRFTVSAAPYNHDICINISDATRNGQYEPYWKRTLPLNLGSFKVKSPNIWDEEREGGAIDTTSGQNTTSNTIFRSKNYIEVLPNTEYCCSLDGGVTTMSLGIFYYDSSKNYISYTSSGISASSNKTFTIPSNCSYIRFTLYGASTTWGTTPPTFSICVNKSDPAFNGRYFSHEDITITGGLKGNGDWADYIVGNKYVKRAERINLASITFNYNSTSTDLRWESANTVPRIQVLNNSSIVPNAICSNLEVVPIATQNADTTKNNLTSWNAKLYVRNGSSTSAPSGYIDIALQYPETYELAEPLVTTVKAGTTEARISPNADGLSAPFCADIQYGSTHADLANDINSVYVGAQNGLEEVRSTFQETVDGIRTLLSNI